MLFRHNIKPPYLQLKPYLLNVLLSCSRPQPGNCINGQIEGSVYTYFDLAVNLFHQRSYLFFNAHFIYRFFVADNLNSHSASHIAEKTYQFLIASQKGSHGCY